MMKNSQTTGVGMNEDEAVGVGIDALEFLASDPELLSRFLSITGLEPQQLRQEAGKPAFFAGVLDFLLDHEPTLEIFAARTNARPETIVVARDALGNAFGVTAR